MCRGQNRTLVDLNDRDEDGGLAHPAATDPIVSTDIIGENHSSIVDLELISQVAPNFFRVVSWYDNENSYSVRCVDLLVFMAEKDNS